MDPNGRVVVEDSSANRQNFWRKWCSQFPIDQCFWGRFKSRSSLTHQHNAGFKVVDVYGSSKFHHRGLFVSSSVPLVAMVAMVVQVVLKH